MTAPVILKHPTDPTLCGPVTFKAPDVFASIAIQRRITELANLGRDPEKPALHPSDLPIEGYRMCFMVATLEHVILTAPAGLYTEINGRAVLAPGMLDDLEAQEEDGAILLLYAAYEEWRSSFRRQRNSSAHRNDQIGAGKDDSLHSQNNEPESPDRVGHT